jgi:CDP-diacylglycerol--serine O-phosphatidyltransferase
MLGVYNYTVVLTYMSVVSAVLGIFVSLSGTGHPYIGTMFLLFCGLCDAFDGKVASTKKNRSKLERNFGIQIDSLCDAICFGVTPAVILYFSGVNGALGLASLVFYVLCAVIRLAFFNVLETRRQTAEGGCAKSYRGLPVTTSAIIFPFFYLISPLIPCDILRVVYHVLPALTGFLFIFDFSVPKIDIGKMLAKKK